MREYLASRLINYKRKRDGHVPSLFLCHFIPANEEDLESGKQNRLHYAGLRRFPGEVLGLFYGKSKPSGDLLVDPSRHRVP